MLASALPAGQTLAALREAGYFPVPTEQGETVALAETRRPADQRPGMEHSAARKSQARQRAAAGADPVAVARRLVETRTAPRPKASRRG